MVQVMAPRGTSAVDELDQWGAGFARTEDSRLDQRYLGAHVYRRTCYAGTYTGREILIA